MVTSRCPGRVTLRFEPEKLQESFQEDAVNGLPAKRNGGARGGNASSHFFLFYLFVTTVSTARIAGRCWAIVVQFSPSSVLANSVPPVVPK